MRQETKEGHAMNGNPLLINKPKLKSSVRSLAENLFSATFWVIFLYFFQPLVTTLVWLTTGYWLYYEVFSYSMVHSIADMLSSCLFFSIFIAAVMLGWSLWNIRCYGGLDRRKPRPSVTDEITAAVYSVPRETIAAARRAQVALIIQENNGVRFEIIKEAAANPGEHRRGKVQ